MTARDTGREKFYDDEIAPLLVKISEQCKERGLSFFAVCEWEPGEFGRTLIAQADASLAVLLANAAAKANGNVDALIMGIMKYATEHGHSSACLSILGVPVKPVAKVPQENS